MASYTAEKLFLHQSPLLHSVYACSGRDFLIIIFLLFFSFAIWTWIPFLDSLLLWLTFFCLLGHGSQFVGQFPIIKARLQQEWESEKKASM